MSVMASATVMQPCCDVCEAGPITTPSQSRSPTTTSLGTTCSVPLVFVLNGVPRSRPQSYETRRLGQSLLACNDLSMSSPTFNSTSSRYKTFLDLNHDNHLERNDPPTHIPDPQNIMTSTNDVLSEAKLKCCCGRPDCAFLEHNNLAVDDLERKLERAAQLGQVRALMSCVCLLVKFQSPSGTDKVTPSSNLPIAPVSPTPS
jgi:hypothetical protein